MTNCTCGLEQPYEECCEPIIKGEKQAETAESLMRSRYSAFAHAEVDWLVDSVHPETREDHDRDSIRVWAVDSQWSSLEIVSTHEGGSDDETGEVEFIANYKDKQGRHRHHELAQFKKHEGQWYFYDGGRVKPQTVVRDAPKVGRNDPCPCGSGKKFKKCCAKK